MKYPLFRYQDILRNIKPIAAKGMLDTVTILRARLAEEALEHVKLSLMREILYKAAEGQTEKVHWDVTHQFDGIRIYTEFYIFSREQLAALLDDAYLMGKRDAGTMVAG